MAVGDYEKIYFDEFQHSIIDLGEKVTLTSLSDKYERPIEEIASALSKWLETQATDKILKIEYILRGNHKNGYPLITIVPKEKLQKARESVENAYDFIYSAEISNSSPSLDFTRLSSVKKKNLILPEEILQRKASRPSAPVAADGDRKQDPIATVPKKSASNFFTKLDSTKKTISVVKTENKNNNKEEETSKSGQEVKPTEIKKGSPLKVKGSKGSIASFFSAKPTTEKNSSTVSKIHENQQNDKKADKAAKCIELDDDFEVVEEKPSKKRHLEDSDTKDISKNAKKQKVIAGGRRRLIIDSSDDENSAEENQPVPESEPEPEELVKGKENKIEKIEENKAVEVNPPQPLTYQDEDGFLVTVKGKKPHAKKVEKPSPIKKTLTKLNKVPVKIATKQGSIRNFFTKN